MAVNPAVPFWDEGNTFTAHAGAAITGKRFVTISGARVDDNPRVNHQVGSATKRSVGVAAYDAASGRKVTIYSAPGIVVPVTTAEAITAGDDVYSDANGFAVKTQPAGARPSGTALDDAASGTDAVIKLIA
jgi:predicted RecA/RadA family phage recombinase